VTKIILLFRLWLKLKYDIIPFKLRIYNFTFKRNTQAPREKEMDMDKTVSMKKMSGMGHLELKDETSKEIEQAFGDVDPKKFEDCEKICALNPEVQKTIKKIKKGPECNELKDKITKLLSSAKRKDGFTDETSDTKKLKIEAKIKKNIMKIKNLLNRIPNDARGAYVLVTRNHYKEIAQQFNISPKTRESLENELWKGIAIIAVGVALGVGGAGIVLAAGGICLAAVPAVGVFIAAACFLGFGVYKLYQNIKDRMEAKERERIESYQKLCEEMIKHRLV